MDAVYPWGLTTAVTVTPDTERTTEESAQVISAQHYGLFVYKSNSIIVFNSKSNI